MLRRAMTTQNNVNAYARRAPITRYFVTNENAAGALSETGPAVKLAALSGG